MTADHMDDKIVAGQIAEQAQELADRSTHENDSDHSPWGGKFTDKPLDRKVFAVDKPGDC